MYGITAIVIECYIAKIIINMTIVLDKPNFAVRICIAISRGDVVTMLYINNEFDIPKCPNILLIAVSRA